MCTLVSDFPRRHFTDTPPKNVRRTERYCFVRAPSRPPPPFPTKGHAPWKHGAPGGRKRTPLAMRWRREPAVAEGRDDCLGFVGICPGRFSAGRNRPIPLRAFRCVGVYNNYNRGSIFRARTRFGPSAFRLSANWRCLRLDIPSRPVDIDVMLENPPSSSPCSRVPLIGFFSTSRWWRHTASSLGFSRLFDLSSFSALLSTVRALRQRCADLKGCSSRSSTCALLSTVGARRMALEA